MPRLRGHLPDPPGAPRARDVAELVGVRPSVCTMPDFVDNAHLVPEVKDQRGSSCEGAGWWAALSAAAATDGRALDLSYLAIYTGARMLDAPGAERLADAGSFTYRVRRFVETFGLIARARWTDDAPLTVPLPQDCFEAGVVAKVGGIYEIPDKGAARFASVEAAVARGLYVVTVMPVTQAYEDGPGDVYALTGDRPLGLHCQALTGYERRKPGVPGRYKLKGSWGREWNDGGSAWVHEDVLADAMTDLYVATIAPQVTR